MERVWCVTSNTPLLVSRLLPLSHFLFYFLSSFPLPNFVGFPLIRFALGCFLMSLFFTFSISFCLWGIRDISLYFPELIFEWIYLEKMVRWYSNVPFKTRSWVLFVKQISASLIGCGPDGGVFISILKGQEQSEDTRGARLNLSSKIWAVWAETVCICKVWSRGFIG